MTAAPTIFHCQHCQRCVSSDCWRVQALLSMDLRSLSALSAVLSKQRLHTHRYFAVERLFAIYIYILHFLHIDFQSLVWSHYENVADASALRQPSTMNKMLRFFSKCGVLKLLWRASPYLRCLSSLVPGLSLLKMTASSRPMTAASSGEKYPKS